MLKSHPRDHLLAHRPQALRAAFVDRVGLNLVVAARVFAIRQRRDVAVLAIFAAAILQCGVERARKSALCPGDPARLGNGDTVRDND